MRARRSSAAARRTREEYAAPDDEGMRYLPSPDKFACAGDRDGRVVADARLARMLSGDPEAPRPWSATKLGELAACGFKFFAGRVLALSEDEEPDYELSPLEGGEIIHDVLHRLVDKIDFTDASGARARAGGLLKAGRAGRRLVA